MSGKQQHPASGPPSEYALDLRSRLVSAHVDMVGREPSGGGWTPSGETLAKLEAFEAERGRAATTSLLRMAITAHLHRTRTSNTPFFANSHIFGGESMEYIKMHGAFLGRMYNEAVDPNSFTRRVYSAVFAGERDYLQLGCSYHLSGRRMDWAVMVPTVFWAVASQLLGRFKTGAACWADAPVYYGGQRVRMGAAHAAERAEIRSSAARRKAVLAAAGAAMLDAARGWAAESGLISVYRDDFGGLSCSPDSLIDPSLLRVEKPLLDRDARLFEAARPAWEARGRGGSAPPPVGDRESPLSLAGVRSGMDPSSMDPMMAKMLEAAAME